MRAPRRGKEFYSGNYEAVMKMHQDGLTVAQIAQKTGMSYSAVYHWVKGLRRPEQGNVTEFISFLKTKGPLPVTDLKEKFPKHNELFLICSKRGLGIKRYMMKKKFADYSTWYYLEGQESELQKRVDSLIEKVKEVKEKLNTMMG